MRKQLLRILLCALFLAGSSALRAAEQIRVACVGNSITAGSGISNDSEKYPSQLQQILGDGYKVGNFGSSGATAQTISDSESYIKRDVYPKALAFDPNIVIIKLGTNDAKAANWTDPERFKTDMRYIINSFRDLDTHPQIYLCLPLRTIKSDFGILETNIHKIIPLIYELGEEYDIPVINLHTVMEEALGAEWETAYNDGVHPNPTGARIMAERIADAILNANYGTYDPAHTPRKVQIVSCIGGSRLKTGVNTDQYYPAVLQTMSNGTLSAVNAGVVNRTLLRSGKENSEASVTCGYADHNDFTNNVINKSPDIVTIDLGEKDTSEWNWANKDELEQDITHLVDNIRQSNASAKIYLCLPTRTKGDCNTSNVRGAVMREELYPILRDVAAKLNVDVVNTASAVDAANYLSDGYRYNAVGHTQMANMLYTAINGTYTDPGDGDGNNPVGGAGSETELPDDAEYYVIAEYPGELNGTLVPPGANDPWFAYNNIGLRDTPFSLEGCDSGNLYLEFDMYVEAPDVADGDPAFPGIVWGKTIPSNEEKGPQPQNYFFVKLVKPKTSTTDRYEWTFTDMNEEMNDAFGAILSNVKSGQWNHIVIPFSYSPRIDQLPMDGGYNTIAISFARMKKDNYVFKSKNVKLQDRSRYFQNVTIETGYSFFQPANAGNEASVTLGGDKTSLVYLRLDFNMAPEITDPANTSFCFDVEISAVDGVEDSALLGNLTSNQGSKGLRLTPGPASEIPSASVRADYYNLKTLDWQFGKHTYTIPLSSMQLTNMKWDDAPITSCLIYLYDNETTLGKIDTTFSNFCFKKRELVDVDDIPTSIEEVEFVTESDDSNVTIYNLCGIPVFKGVYTDAQLPSGIYVVVSPNGARKVRL